MSPTEPTSRFADDVTSIAGSAAFRRLAGKTQVHAFPLDPAVRTRLTHTFEVASLAREIGIRCRLRTDLVEAISLGHDLGHPAFGHAGERALARTVPGGFHHARQSVRACSELEPLHLSPEVLDGILHHSKGESGPLFPKIRGEESSGGRSVEGGVVRAADLYAYACHDVDDAYRLKLLSPTDLPREATRVLGSTPSSFRRHLVDRTIEHLERTGLPGLDAEAQDALAHLRGFLYANLYRSRAITDQSAWVAGIISRLWRAANRQGGWGEFSAIVVGEGIALADHGDIADHFRDALASMTDAQVLRIDRAMRIASPSPLVPRMGRHPGTRRRTRVRRGDTSQEVSAPVVPVFPQ